jgi:hypothetical protein
MYEEYSECPVCGTELCAVRTVTEHRRGVMVDASGNVSDSGEDAYARERGDEDRWQVTCENGHSRGRIVQSLDWKDRTYLNTYDANVSVGNVGTAVSPPAIPPETDRMPERMLKSLCTAWNGVEEREANSVVTTYSYASDGGKRVEFTSTPPVFPTPFNYKRAGFTVWMTGGGCEAWGLVMDDGCELLITDYADPSLPCTDHVTLGLYDSGGEPIECVDCDSVEMLEAELKQYLSKKVKA